LIRSVPRVAWLAVAALAGVLACDNVTTDPTADNTPPTADLTANDASVPLGTTVTFDGTGSSDPDGDDLTFSWQLSGPAGTGKTLAGETSATVTLEPDVEGEYSVQMTVSDGEDSDSETVQITATNTAPTAVALPEDTTVSVGVTVDLDGSQSSDADGHTLSFSWELETPAGSEAMVTNPDNMSASFTPDMAGEFLALFTVSDGYDTDMDTTVVTVVEAGDPPSIVAVSAGGHIAFDVAHKVFVEATDPDSEVLTYAWNLIEGPGDLYFPDSTFDTDTTAMAVSAVGTHLVEVTVSDGANTVADTIEFEAHDPVIAANITTDRTLPMLLNAPYLVSGGIDVSAALTILPGAVLEHAAGARIDVLAAGGSLNAEGTAAKQIVFMGEAPTAGYWEGIIIRSNDALNVLDHVQMSDAGDYPNDGNLEIDTGARLTVSNSRFENSATAGLMANGATNLTFSNNVFTDNVGPALDIPATVVGLLDSGSDYYNVDAPNGKAFINVRSATISSDQTWPATDAPFRFLDNTVLEDATLTIVPGANFLFGASARLTISATGVLSAVGTAEAPITMFGEGNTPGYWEGLHIQSNAANELAYVELAYGGEYPVDGNLEIGAGAQATIANSTFRNGEAYGLFVHSGASLPGFANNTFAANTGPALAIPAHLAGSLDTGSDYTNVDGTKAYVAVAATVVNTEQTWSAINAPYRFSGETTIEDATVTIDAGAAFLFNTGARLNVTSTGALSAVGTSTDRITFEGEGKTAGYWEGILIQSNNTVNEIGYADVAHAGAYPNEGNLEVAPGARVGVHSSTFSSSEDFGLFLADGAIFSAGGRIPGNFSNNGFYDNTSEGLRIPASMVGSIDGASVYYDAEAPNGKSYVGVFASTVTTDQTWPATGAPLRFEGETDLDGAAITIEAGADMLFASNSRIDVMATGSLTAVGTATDSITFLGENGVPGAWEGIVFRSNDAANQLQYVNIGFGGNYPNSGNVHIAAGQASITDSFIHDSESWGIYVDGSATATVSGNSYSGNASGDVTP